MNKKYINGDFQLMRSGQFFPRNSSIIDWVANGQVEVLIMSKAQEPDGTVFYVGKLSNKPDETVIFEDRHIV